MDKEENLAAIPRHLAIIMDGNGRWAQQRGLPRMSGHQAGTRVVSAIAEAAAEFGVQVLTLYTFSTENWCRPKEEVDFLMRLAEEYATAELPEIQRNGICLQLMGRREGLPLPLLKALDEAFLKTKENSRLILNLAINYGGRAEIVDAMRAIIAEHQKGKLDISDIDETAFSFYLYCANTPDVDMILRTGGEWRLSNFLVWRSISAVFLSLPVLWPDFRREHLQDAINLYSRQMLEFHNGE